MKIRTLFISNSSSSSFCILKKNLTEKQIKKIYNHIKKGKKLGIEWCSPLDAWEITEEDDFLKGFTCMDNFDMREFLGAIGVPREDVVWDMESDR